MPAVRDHKLKDKDVNFDGVKIHRGYKIPANGGAYFIGYDRRLGVVLGILYGHDTTCQVFLGSKEKIDPDEVESWVHVYTANDDNCGFNHDKIAIPVAVAKQFAHDVKSGWLANEVKKAIALAEAKEAAEVKLFKQQREEEEDLVADLS
jgi:hypothetical protein